MAVCPLQVGALLVFLSSLFLLLPVSFFSGVRGAVSQASLQLQKGPCTRGKGGKHDLGEPHVHLWSAVIGVALNSVPPEAKATLQSHVDDANRGGPSSLLNKVMYARMKKTFDKKFMRFYFSVHPSMEGILDIVMAALTKVGGQEKYGTAPKSSLERDIQAKLDALN